MNQFVVSLERIGPVTQPLDERLLAGNLAALYNDHFGRCYRIICGPLSRFFESLE